MAKYEPSGIIPGLSDSQSTRTKPRTKTNIFSHVPDPFEEKSILGSHYEKDQSKSKPIETPVQKEPNTENKIVDKKVDSSAGHSLKCEKEVLKSLSVPFEKVEVESNDRLFIKNGTIINNDHSFVGDIYIEDGIIKCVGPNLDCPPQTTLLNAAGKYIIPGGIDINTYLYGGIEGIRTAGDFTTGTKAALAGGTTTVFDMIVCPRECSPLELYNKRREMADSKVCTDFGFVMTLTEMNARISSDMNTLVNEKGVNCFQFHMGYRNTAMLDDDDLYDMFRLCRRLGAVAMVQADNGRVVARKEIELLRQGITGPEGHASARSEESEAEATGRVIVLADQANCPVVVNPIGSLLAGQRLASARREGKIVFGGCTPAHFLLDSSVLLSKDWRTAAGHVTSPALRNAETRQGLLGLLAAGDLGVSGSGHRVYTAECKALGKSDFRAIPEGLNGIQERMSLLWEASVKTGLLDPCKFVSVTSSNAAHMLNLYPRKGYIGVGSDADLVIWNPNLSRPVRPSTKYLPGMDLNVFSHIVCSAGPEVVVSQGRVVVRSLDNAGCPIVEVEPGSGRFLTAAPFPQMLYTRLFAKEKANIPQPVVREAYSGPVIDIVAEQEKKKQELVEPAVESARPSTAEVAAKGDTSSDGGSTNRSSKYGVRNMQESSFAFSGSQIDDNRPKRSGIRTQQPPGGASTNPFW